MKKIIIIAGLSIFVLAAKVYLVHAKMIPGQLHTYCDVEMKSSWGNSSFHLPRFIDGTYFDADATWSDRIHNRKRHNSVELAIPNTQYLVQELFLKSDSVQVTIFDRNTGASLTRATGFPYFTLQFGTDPQISVICESYAL